MNRLASLLLVGLLAGCAPSPELDLAQLFSDSAVLQRDVPVRVWGTAAPGSSVSVSIADKSGSATAAADSTWTVQLEPSPAGGPHVLVVQSGPDRIERTDVFFGDVWIASGQSNMEWTVSASGNAEAEIAAASDTGIRHFKVPRSWSFAPETTLAGGDWRVTGPEEVGSFSAVGYFFARQSRAQADVPIGILNASWGGSRIEPWMSAEMLGMSDADIQALVEADADAERTLREQLTAVLGEIPETDEGLVDGVAHWADPDMDDGDWARLAVPGMWEGTYPGVDGIAWYRRSISLTAEEASADALLGVGQVDDSDITWVNGTQVGSMQQSYNVPREYPVPAAALREGENVVVVRVEDTGGGGGLGGTPEQVFLRTATTTHSLTGDWAFRVGAARINVDGQRHQTPTLLYNKMIRPIVPFAAKGFIWYQGESNSGRQDAEAYRDQFQTMITSWRSEWGLGDMPFLWVQLANFQAPDVQPAEGGWAFLRESQTAALSLPNTGEAVIIDIGEAGDIHPRNKQDVGARLALWARHLAGEDVVYRGPAYAGHERQGRSLVVAFDHVAEGLEARERTEGVSSAPSEPARRLEGFAIAGADGRYHWAEARIEGNSVVLMSPRVPAPLNVRYAWGNNPDKANLYNSAGLPATPFRTDTD